MSNPFTIPALKKSTVVIASILIGAGVIVAIIGIVHLRSAANDTSSSSLQNPNTPPFAALLPQNKTIESLGGWQKLTPPNGDATYVYIDTIEGVTVNVSQQALPESLKQSSGARIAELAKGYNAERTLSAGETTIYIGTSTKGPQSVIFTKNNLLLLIVSQGHIEDTAWSTYVESLI